MKTLAVSDSHHLTRAAAAQYQYSLVKRDIEYEFSDLCLSEGVGLTAWGPLGGGFLSGKYKRGERPSDPDSGRIASAGEDVEEAWQRRDTARNWRIVDAVGEIADERGGDLPADRASLAAGAAPGRQRHFGCAHDVAAGG